MVGVYAMTRGNNRAPALQLLIRDLPLVAGSSAAVRSVCPRRRRPSAARFSVFSRTSENGLPMASAAARPGSATTVFRRLWLAAFQGESNRRSRKSITRKATKKTMRR